MRDVVLLWMVLFLVPGYVVADDITLFEYWSRPLSIGEKTPYPENCGECHKRQYTDWIGSLHRRSVGPGLLSQLKPEEYPDYALSCYYCHAPAVEQNEMVRRGDGYVRNDSFDRRLKHSGISCVICHVRKGRIYGPVPSGNREGGHPFTVKDFFSSAEFCRVCHQLDGGYELNGKVLVNTYREWKESPYGKNNITCQHCHMPDRRHLFRGIHDPEMVRNGVDFEVRGGKEKITLLIKNTGVGHNFPTYVTPLVVVRGFVVDGSGTVVGGTLRESFVGRKVTLDLTEELFDTRIPPGGEFGFEYPVDGAKGKKIVLEVWVYPDEFYNRFFHSALEDTNSEDIKEALDITENSFYLLFREEVRIPERPM